MLAIYISMVICEFLNLKYEGFLGNIVHFIVALIVSRMTPPPPEHIQDLVEKIRIPSGAGEPLEY